MSSWPVKNKRQRPESVIQIAIVEMLAVVLLPGAIVHASLNEEASGTQRMINAAMGARAGFADLVVIVDGLHLYVEVKTPTGSQSPAQVAFQQDCEAMGLVYEVVRSLDDVLAVLRRHGVRTRIASAAGVPWARIRLQSAVGRGVA